MASFGNDFAIFYFIYVSPAVGTLILIFKTTLPEDADDYAALIQIWTKS